MTVWVGGSTGPSLSLQRGLWDHRFVENYWIVKGKPKRNDFAAWLKPSTTNYWITKKPPKAWGHGDRLFFWHSSPKLEVIGLGEFLEELAEPTRDGFTRFQVRYLSGMLPKPIGIEVLRGDPVLGSASFLKSGPAGTVFPITLDQGARLYQLVCDQDPSLRKVWPDLNQRSKLAH